MATLPFFAVEDRQDPYFISHVNMHFFPMPTSCLWFPLHGMLHQFSNIKINNVTMKYKIGIIEPANWSTKRMCVGPLGLIDRMVKHSSLHLGQASKRPFLPQHDCFGVLPMSEQNSSNFSRAKWHCCHRRQWFEFPSFLPC